MNRPAYPCKSGYRHRTQIIGEAWDIDGEHWAVRKRVRSPHGIFIEYGWRMDQVPGPGIPSRGVSLILTPVLAQALHDLPIFNEAKAALGISHTALNQLRRRVAMRHRDQLDRWWRDRIDGLKTLPIDTFARCYGVHPDTVKAYHQRLVGPTQPGTNRTWEYQRVNQLMVMFLDHHADTGFTDLRHAKQNPAIPMGEYGYREETPQGPVYLFTSDTLVRAIPEFTLKRISRALEATGWVEASTWVNGEKPIPKPRRISGRRSLYYHVHRPNS